MRFQNYNVEAQCTPTRSAILTGRLPKRSGTISVPLPGQGHYGLSPWEYTLAELMSDARHATALFGKRHLGDIEGRLPTDQGFDEWFGIKRTRPTRPVTRPTPCSMKPAIQYRGSGKG